MKYCRTCSELIAYAATDSELNVVTDAYFNLLLCISIQQGFDLSLNTILFSLSANLVMDLSYSSVIFGFLASI